VKTFGFKHSAKIEGNCLKLRFLGRASIAVGIGAAGFQALCSAGQVVARRPVRVDVKSVALPVLAGVLCLVAGKFGLRGRRVELPESLWRTAGPLSNAGPIEETAASGRIAYSIIVPVYNRPGDIAALMRRLNEHWETWKSLGRGEVVIVDDGSTDDTAAVARSCAKGSAFETTVITQPNAGSSGARNAGFMHARGVIGVSIDSDCLPCEEWLPNLLRHVDSKKRVVAFGAVTSDRRARMPAEVTPAGIEFITASFAVPVDLYWEIGGFFGAFNGQFRDDTDFVLSARRAGITTVQVNDAVVWHPIRAFATLKGVWRTSLAHRYDALLAVRHGEAAIPFVSNILLGGGLWGNFPTSCLLYGAIDVLAVSLVAMRIARPSLPLEDQLSGWLGLVLVPFLVGAFGVVYHEVPAGEVPRYVASVATYMVGATAGRMRGSIERGIALL